MPEKTAPRASGPDGVRTDRTALTVPLDFLTELANTATLDELFETVATRLPEIFPADRISIALRHSDSTLSVAAVKGRTIQYDMQPIPIQGTKIGACFSSRKPIVVMDADRPGEEYARAQTPGQDRYRSTAILPLIVGDECLGTLNFGCIEANSFPARCVEDLSKIAIWIALQISRYKAIEQLQASQSRFDALIENARSMIFAKDATGRMLIANGKYCETVGLRRDQIIGRTDTEIFGAQTAAHWRKDDLRILESEEGGTFEEEIRHADGTIRPHITQKFPIFDSAQGTKIVCGISTDISERKRAEKALAESESRARAFFHNSPNMMFTKGLDQKLTFVNPEYLRFYGQTEEETLNRKTTRDVDPERRAELQAIDEAVLSEGKIRRDELHLQSSTGETHTLLVTKFPIYDGDGNIIGLGGVNTDVTELRNREKELRVARDEATMAAEMFKDAADKAKAADIAKSDFLASMSHELRTPLNGVMGMANLLLDHDLDPEQRHKVETIHTSGQALLTLLNDILDLSKIEAGELELENHDFSLSDLMSGVEDLWESQARTKGLRWSCKVDLAVSDVLHGDSTKVRQVVFNLLSNAIKFTDQGGIAVSVTQSGGNHGIIETMFEIADTGSGIDGEAGETLFDKFTQANSSIARRYGGTGLGLAICRSLVELMDGEISYESEIDAGTIFRFTVKCAAGDPDRVSARARRQNDGQPVAGENSLRILVAEDNNVNQQVIRLMLLRSGHQCDIVGNGFEAVAAVQAQPYDLVIMDIQMPEMDGITATAKIRDLGGIYTDLPIIALTANAMKGDDETYFEAGMNDYVPKPIDPPALSAAIARQTGGAAGQATAPAAASPAAPTPGADTSTLEEVDALFSDLGLPDDD